MRPRSITGPVIIIAVGSFFLINNVRPDLLAMARFLDYWPFLLIGAGIIGLVEVLFHVKRGLNPPPRPLAGAGVFWVVILCFVLAIVGRNRNIRIGPFFSPGATIFGSDYDYDVSAAESARGITRVVLDNVRGNLSIKGESDPGEIRVTGRNTLRAINRDEADRESRDLQVHFERQGDVLLLRIGEVRGRRMGRVSSDLDIIVPQNVAVEARGGNGDLTIDSIDASATISGGRGDLRISHIGQDVRIDASRSGDIHAVDVKGKFDLQGRGSDLQVESVEGPVTINGEYSGTLEFHALAKPFRFRSSRTDFSAEAVPGTIRLDLGTLKMSDVTGPVHFQTGTRDIEADDVTDALELSVGRGDIRVTESKSPLPRMDIHARNGDITVSLPEKAAFEIHGSTSQGDVESGFGHSLQIDTSGRSATIRGQTGTGPLLNISTDRGTVSIQKS